MYSSMQVTSAILVSLLAYFLYSEFLSDKDAPVAVTKYGKLQGKISHSRDGRQYFKYLGIPYATPPIGDLRFEPPKPPKSWSGIRKANKFGQECVQMEIMATGRILGDEDCLYLNVLSPNINSKKLLPVMFYIYGGLFMAGSGDLYDGDYFMDEDVVLVTFNYRVAALGFLNTDDDVVRGNMGLKDQRLALQWVHENIEAFGGDPLKVTLFGESAGGASVHYHMLSNTSAGMFHKAISQSGTATFKWVISQDSTKPQADAFAKYFNCPTENTTEMISCLRNVPARELVRYHRPVMHPLRQRLDAFIPTIEKFIHEDTFLHKHPLEILKNDNVAKIPWMAGVASDEGLYLAARLILNEAVCEDIGPKWNEIAPLLLDYRAAGNEETTARIRKRYFGDVAEIIPREMPMQFSRMFSEYWFFHEYNIASEEDLIAVEVKMAFQMVKELFNTHVLGNPTPVLGACHADDLPVLFNFHPLLYINKNSEHYEMSKQMVKTWAAFASDKSPLKFNGILWPQIQTGDKLKYMNLTIPGGIIDDPFNEIIEFWNTIKIV